MKGNVMKNIKLKSVVIILILLIIASSSQILNAHCEVPCGIYGDSLRVALIKEHITTVEKAMIQINKLSGESEKNYNQIVRWVVNKEEHAEKIQEIVSQYFLHQRIKLTDPTDEKAYSKYQKQLEQLHKLLVYSMKSKQSTDLKIIEKLKTTTDEFASLYFPKNHHHHKH